MTFEDAEPSGLIQDVPAAMERDATSNCTGLSSTGMGGNGGRMGDTTSFMILLLDTMVLQILHEGWPPPNLVPGGL